MSALQYSSSLILTARAVKSYRCFVLHLRRNTTRKVYSAVKSWRSQLNLPQWTKKNPEK